MFPLKINAYEVFRCQASFFWQVENKKDEQIHLLLLPFAFELLFSTLVENSSISL